MKSLPKFAILGLLLLLAAPATEAAAITSTDTINFNSNAYISQWPANLNSGTDAVTKFPLQPDRLDSGEVDSPATATDGNSPLQSSGIVSLLDKVDRDKPHPPKPKPKPTTVPEPGALSLIGLGLFALALMMRRTRRLRSATLTAEGVSVTSNHSSNLHTG
jgi:hypothetical protein